MCCGMSPTGVSDMEPNCLLTNWTLCRQRVEPSARYEFEELHDPYREVPHRYAPYRSPLLQCLVVDCSAVRRLKLDSSDPSPTFNDAQKAPHPSNSLETSQHATILADARPSLLPHNGDYLACLCRLRWRFII